MCYIIFLELGQLREMSMITYFETHKPLRRGGKNGGVDLRGLDRVLQNLKFAPKPHPTIFIKNEPEAVFDGLEKFQRSNRLTIDGAVKNKDSETGRALNKAMAEFYVPSGRKQAGGTDEDRRPKSPKNEQRPDVILTVTDPGRPQPDEDLEREIAEK
jgi:hypothetical protein